MDGGNETSTARHQVVLFIDWQNVYKGSRETFDLKSKFHTQGQVNPVEVGRRIVGKYVPGAKRSLAEVRVYTGRPDPRQDSKTYAAHMRQCAGWEKSGLVVIRHRQLRYPRDWPDARAEEKGIDVQIAIDFVMGIRRADFDIGVIFSTDTDLLPALEAGVEIARAEGRPLPEVAAWRGHGGKGRGQLRISGMPLRPHLLEWADYQACHDDTDYNVAPER
jgi:uncharacterized LabA/DUF88 family protein